MKPKKPRWRHRNTAVPSSSTRSKRLMLALGGAAVTLTLPSSAHADFFEHRWENRRAEAATWRLTSELRYFSSTENFIGAGTNPTAVTGLTDHSRIGFDAIADFGLTDRLTLYGRVSWARSQFDQTALATSVNSYGLTDQSVGASFRFVGDEAGDGPTLDVQFQIDFPLYRNADQYAQGTPWLGDQSIDATAGAFGALPLSSGSFGSLALEGGTGFTWRSNGFKPGIPYRAFAHYRSRESFRARVGAEGYLSLEGNGFSIALAENLSNGAGGSLRIGSTAPSFLDAAASVGYRVSDRAWVDLKGSRSVWGERAPSSTQVVASFSFTIPGADARPLPARGSDGERAESPAAKAKTGSRAPRKEAAAQAALQAYSERNPGFVRYGAEGKVLKVIENFQMVRIDLGADQGVERGQIYDIFRMGADHQLGEPVARAKATEVRLDEATLVITEWFGEPRVETGFAAKRLLD